MTVGTQQYVEVQLPSRGVLYSKEGIPQIPEGRVGVRKLGAVEDANIFGQGNIAKRISRAVEACTRLPNAFPHQDLLVTDHMFLLLAMRTVTHGPKYTFDYRCSQCRVLVPTTVDISEDLNERTGPRNLSNDPLADPAPLVEPVEVKLPDAGKTVALRFLRVSDEDLVLRRSSGQMAMKTMDGNDAATDLYRIAISLQTVDGEPFKVILDKERFVQRLTAGDAQAIRLAMDAAESGVDLTIYPECPRCNGQTEMEMPFTVEYFRPSRR